MKKPSSRLSQLTRPRAASRLRRLLDEVQMLMASFPDLRDAFDADELPAAFILKRDSRRSARALKRPTRTAASLKDAVSGRKKSNGD
jgi:hypothetical protein